jgi:hypothetical protein
MPHCKICARKDCPEINRKTVVGVPGRAICAAHGVSLGGWSRHRAHIKQLLAEANAAREDERAEHGSALLKRVLRLSDEAEKILAAASAKNDFRGANGALGAAAKLLDLCARLSGELQSANAGGLHLTLMNRVTNTTIVNYDTDIDFAVMIGEATRGFDVNELLRLKALAESASFCNERDTRLLTD